MNHHKKHYLLITLGSIGDILPMVSVGSSLGLRGHRVTLVGPPANCELAKQNGINDYIPISTNDQYAASLKDKFLIETRYNGLFFLRHAVAWNTAIYTAAQRYESAELRMLAVDRPNLWGDLVAHAHLRIPLIRVSIDLPITGAVGTERTALPAGSVQVKLMARWLHSWSESMRQRGVSTLVEKTPGYFELRRYSCTHMSTYSFELFLLWKPLFQQFC